MTTAAKLIDTAEFCVTLGADDMDGISAENLAHDILNVVPKLLTAADVLYDAIVWMSGSPSFSPGGEAHEGWLKRRDEVSGARATFGGTPVEA